MPDPAATKPGETEAFKGEESGRAESTPDKDLWAACVIAVIAVAAIVLAARFPNPGEFFSAPSLLPILTGASLLLMAFFLGANAVRNGARLQFRPQTGRAAFADDFERRRTLLLILIVVLYAVTAGLISFDLRYPVGGMTLRLSSYEVVSFVYLTVILRIFWRASLARCVLVSLIAVLALASIFRYGFKILLPGGG